jgi:hypothetical protein
LFPIPSKHPETTRKIFAMNGFSSKKRWSEKVVRKGGQKRWVDNKQKSKMSPECHHLSPDVTTIEKNVD